MSAKDYTSDKPMQRREFYRLSILKDIKFKVLDEYRSAEHAAYLLNISGGGAEISAEQSIDESRSVLLQIDLDGEEIEVLASIVRKQYINDKNIYNYGVSFGALDTKLQDKIIQYIHKEQTKALKRGIRE